MTSLPHRECTDGWPAAPLRVVDDVVVHERGGVDELDDRGVQHGELARVARQARRHQQHGRPDALAPAVLDVSPDLRDEVDLRFDVAIELCLDLLQVFPDGLEHLDERGVRRVLLDGVSVLQNVMISPYSSTGCQRIDSCAFMSLRPKQAPQNWRGSAGGGLPSGTPRSVARSSATLTTHAGSLRLPRCGVGRQVGAVGFAQDAIGGHERRDLAHIRRLLET